MQYGKNLLVAAMLLSLTTLDVQATLTANGLGVYDSGLSATWAQDANLLGRLEANAISQNGNDNSLISNIINASGGVINDTPNDLDTVPNSGRYVLTAADFGSGGRVDWWAAKAFVHYLDTINYGGSSQWDLPIRMDELYFDELNALSINSANAYNDNNFGIFHNGFGASGHPGSVGPFINVENAYYWTRLDFPYPYDTSFAFDFATFVGLGGESEKYYQSYVWAVSPGQLPAVPIPDAIWLFGTGILGLLGLKQRLTRTKKT